MSSHEKPGNNGTLTNLPESSSTKAASDLQAEGRPEHGGMEQLNAAGLMFHHLSNGDLNYAERAALMGVCHKLARIAFGSYNEDHYDDAIGYINLMRKAKQDAVNR